MTKTQGKNTPRKSAVKALRALRKHSIEEDKSAKYIACASGINYSSIWLWLSRDSANYNLTHLNERHIMEYLNSYNEDWGNKPEEVRVKPNSTGWVEDVKVEPDTTTGLAVVDPQDQDKMLILPKEDVMKIIGFGLNRFLRRSGTELYDVVGLDFEGTSGRITFRSTEEQES